MKAARILAVAVLAAIPALSFADTGHGLTRADVRADLVRLEKAGYRPASSEANYPNDIAAAENAVAAREAELVVLTVPFAAQADTLPPLREACEGKIVVSTAVPMLFEGGLASMPAVPEGSAAEQAQALLPGALVVGAFQNLGAAKLWKGDEPLDQDVVVCGGDEEAKRQVSALAEQIRGVRAVDGGPLSNTRYVEGITVLLVSINKRYKTLAGVRIAGL